MLDRFTLINICTQSLRLLSVGHLCLCRNQQPSAMLYTVSPLGIHSKHSFKPNVQTFFSDSLCQIFLLCSDFVFLCLFICWYVVVYFCMYASFESMFVYLCSLLFLKVHCAYCEMGNGQKISVNPSLCNGVGKHVPRLCYSLIMSSEEIMKSIIMAIFLQNGF